MISPCNRAAPSDPRTCCTIRRVSVRCSSSASLAPAIRIRIESPTTRTPRTSIPAVARALSHFTSANPIATRSCPTRSSRSPAGGRYFGRDRATLPVLPRPAFRSPQSASATSSGSHGGQLPTMPRPCRYKVVATRRAPRAVESRSGSCRVHRTPPASALGRISPSSSACFRNRRIVQRFLIGRTRLARIRSAASAERHAGRSSTLLTIDALMRPSSSDRPTTRRGICSQRVDSPGSLGA